VNADALFKAGKFEQVGRLYEEVLGSDSANLHRRVSADMSGYWPTSSDAEKYLTKARELAPDDKETNGLLADCCIRQDELSRSVSRWRAVGEKGYAEWFAAVSGEPYRIHGDIGRVPWVQMDPVPLVEA